MKARIPMQLNKKQKAAIREAVAEEIRKQGEDSVRRVFKLMCVSLNDDFGFGAGRLARVIDRINTLSREHDNDEVFWEHIDKRLAQMGANFQPEDYELMEGSGRK